MHDEGLSQSHRRRALRIALALGGAIALAAAIVTLLARKGSESSVGSDAMLETSLTTRAGAPSAAESAADAQSPSDAGAWAALRDEDLRTPGVPRGSGKSEAEAVTARRRQILVGDKYYLPEWWIRKKADTDKYYPFLTADGGKGFAPKSRTEDLFEEDESIVTRGTCTDPTLCVKKEGDGCAPMDAPMITPDMACQDQKVVRFTSSGPAQPPSRQSSSPQSPSSQAASPPPPGETLGRCIYNCVKMLGDACAPPDAPIIPLVYSCVQGKVVRGSGSTSAHPDRHARLTVLDENAGAQPQETEPAKTEPDASPETKAPETKAGKDQSYGQPVNQGYASPVYPNMGGGFTLPPGEGCPMTWEQVKNGAKSYPGCPPIPPMPQCPYACAPADRSFEAPEGAAPCPFPCLEFEEARMAQRTPIAVPDKAETGPLTGPDYAKGEQVEIKETAYSAADGNLPIPGTGFLGYGFDSKKDCLFESCATLPIIKWTYNEDKQIVTPAGTYRVPDQMRVLNQYDTTARTDVYASFTQVEEALAVEASISGSSVAVSGSASASYSSSKSSKSEKWFSSRKMDVKLYSLQVRVSNIEESTTFDFSNDVAKLPTRFLDSPRKFLHFIQKWGPFVVLDATFGGTLELTMVTSKSESVGSEDIAAAIEGSYDGIMASGSMQASTALSTKSKQVDESSQTAIHSNGGDPAVARVITDITPGVEKPMFRGDLEAWLNSVPHFPRVVNKIPVLTEIYKLVPGTDDVSISRRNALQMASAVYVGDATASTSSMECVPNKGKGPSNQPAGSTTNAEADKATETTQIGGISVTWANYNRITINECIRFAARGAGEIDVVFSSIISIQDTWTRVHITHEGAQIYEGTQLRAFTKDSGAAAMGSDVIFEDYWICIFADTISYGKGSNEYITWKKGAPIIKPRFYGFGCSTPTSFASVQIVRPDCKWMGSETVPYLITPPEDSIVQSVPITDTELKIGGAGIQDNDCHKWMCRTVHGAVAVLLNDQEWYPAKIYTSKELACDLSHLKGLDPTSPSVGVLVEVSHLTYEFDSDKPQELGLDKKYGYHVQLMRCPGGPDSTGAGWVDCHNDGTCRDSGSLMWECSCPGQWGGSSCNTCNRACPNSSPTDRCDGCKGCYGFLQAPKCTCTDKSKTDISKECLEIDSSCSFCKKCSVGHLGDRCEFKYEWTVKDWTPCQPNKDGHECGVSSQTRTVSCSKVNSLKTMDDSLCTNAGLKKPASTRTCNHKATKCLFQWTENKKWGPPNGVYPDCGWYDEYQTVTCVASWDTSKKVDSSNCLGTKPFAGPRRIFTNFCGKTAMDYVPTRVYTGRVTDDCITGSYNNWEYIAVGGEVKWPLGAGRENNGLQSYVWPTYTDVSGKKVLDSPTPSAAAGRKIDTQQVQTCNTRGNAKYAFGLRVFRLGDCQVVQNRGFGISTYASCPNGYTIISGGCENSYQIGQAYADIGTNRFICGSFENRDSSDPNRKYAWITAQAMCCKTDKIRAGCKWVKPQFDWVTGKYQERTTCPADHYIYGGYCNTNSQAGSYWPFVMIGPENDERSWSCETMDPTGMASNAFCCPKEGVIPNET